ncbi:eukaryotic translation initiation factor 3 subunit [Plasmopara halstedii]|uniref:Eukaryotic translation initiation factor 3 subunit A n=1 Tax=Plasmopara halstedii TaxID=4781 RepID=A0A0P1AG42_PLAHL|nr:eukaryotic translation initiation factor 3 subunit [Plasmopara halstedii]CEG39840.1 eukaryotic translation initiation factor 3 subunit [Plasmopara halstedii]|eukprot:XP_024576209.1 eukaryotic translation initiation factor 3 subunit [Plasmopara halstedii]
MSHFFHKPENALKRARELLAIPNVDAGVLKRTKHSALEILHDALIAKKNRTWQPTHEELMILYLEICLELQMGRVAKDGLHQYRNLCIQHNPASLETVIKHFVTHAERKLAAAKKESNELNILAAAKVDLDAAQTPEDVMLSTTTFEGSSDRTDREVVVPWLRFMWETYRTVLDILKSNTKLEPLYMVTAIQAFDFCVEYQRKIEFRRVCEIMRNHLSSLQKHTATPTSQSTRQMRSWDGFTLDSVERLLEVRYRQLQVATDLELFSEAFRTIDDINNIMNLVEQTPRVDLLVTYYEKLAQIFQVSKNHLFHAHALYKWYSLRVAGLQGLAGPQALQGFPALVSEEEQKGMATRVVLAALSIPLLEFESSSSVLGDEVSTSASQIADNSLSSAARDKNARMAALLGFATTPTRGTLLEDITAAGILVKASTAASEIFQRVELQELDPLQIVKQLGPFLTTIRADPLAKAYINGVERLVVRRVLFQLTRVYASVTIAHLRSIFVGLDVSYEEIESLIARSRSLSTVAHASAPSLSSMYRRNVTQHGSNNAENSSADAVASAQMRTTIRIDHVGQCIRFTDAVDLEANAAQLCLLGERLTNVMSKVPATVSASIAARDEHTKKLFAASRGRLQQQRSEMLARREIIERKKEELENLQHEKLQSFEKKRHEFAQRRAELERERLAQEARRREVEKKLKIQDEIKLKETRQMLDKLGHTDVSDLDLATIDKDKILNEAKEKARKAKELAQQKLRENARRLDYIVRATREEEQPILQRQIAEVKAEAFKRYEEESASKLKIAKEEHEHSLKAKARLAPAIQVTADFNKAHKARRIEEYKKASEEQKKKIMLERLSARVARAKERFEENQRLLRQEEEEKERIRRAEEVERERKLQIQVEEELRRQEEEELRRQEEEEAEESRLSKEKELEIYTQRERENDEKRVEQRSQGRFGSAGARGLSSNRIDRRGDDTDEGEWTHVNRSALSSRARVQAPEGRWERRGPPSRDSFGDRDGHEGGGSRRVFNGDRESSFRLGLGSDREDGGYRRTSGGDRGESGSRFGFGNNLEIGSRRTFGGDREDIAPRRSLGGDREESSLRRAFGGDREVSDSRFGNRRGGDRDDDRDIFRRGSDRNNDRESHHRYGEDRFFSRSNRMPRVGDREGSARETSRAPDSGSWR